LTLSIAYSDIAERPNFKIVDSLHNLLRNLLVRPRYRGTDLGASAEGQELTRPKKVRYERTANTAFSLSRCKRTYSPMSNMIPSAPSSWIVKIRMTSLLAVVAKSPP